MFDDITEELVYECMDNALSSRERSVIILRYGFAGEKPKSLETVGKELNMSRESVRQIETRALRSMCYYFKRTLKRGESLSSFSNEKNIDGTTPYIDKNPVEGYNENIKDYEGYTEEEFESSGRGFK